MNLSDFDYILPPELIAQTPAEPRDASRLMVIDRRDGSRHHRHFREIVEFLQPGDALVFNDSRVIPARLHGRKAGSGGRVEILLLRRREPGTWEALVRPGRRVHSGTIIELNATANGPCLQAKVTGSLEGGRKLITFPDEAPLPELGQIPLPPYIQTPVADPERYQTVYARTTGSVAAPTAGLHFTPELIETISNKGIGCHFVTLHVGLDTFRPVKTENPAEHRMYQEYGVIERETADALARCKAEGRRVVCVGTTTVRLVEAASQSGDGIMPFAGWTDLFILPGYRFHTVDALVTNFHLPRSTLLMLITAFAGRELTLGAYQEAIARGYRFYSFGDAMLIL